MGTTKNLLWLFLLNAAFLDATSGEKLKIFKEHSFKKIRENGNVLLLYTDSIHVIHMVL